MNFTKVALVSLFMAVAAVFLSVAFQPPALLVGIFFIALCVGLAIWRALKEGRRHLFSPLPLILLYMGIGIGGKGIFNLLTHESKIAASVDPTSSQHEELLFKTFLLSGLGIIAYLIGDILAGRGQARARVIGPRRARFVLRGSWMARTGIVFTGIGTIAQLARHGSTLFLSPGSLAVEGMSGLFWTFPLLFGGIFGCGFSILNDWIEKRESSLLKYITFGIVTLFVFTITSSKAAIIISILLLLVGRHLTVGPVKIRSLIISPLLLLVSMPYLYNYRAFGINLGRVPLYDQNPLFVGALQFFNRAYMADSISTILAKTPNIYPYMMGKGYLELFYFWIPRSLWHDKPLSSGLSFGRTYFSESWQAGQAFYSPTLIGDSYMNFGIPGVVLILFIYGFGLRKLYDFCTSAWAKPARILFYCSAVYYIFSSPEGSLVSIISLSFSYLAISYFLLWVGQRTASPKPYNLEDV